MATEKNPNVLPCLNRGFIFLVVILLAEAPAALYSPGWAEFYLITNLVILTS